MPMHDWTRVDAGLYHHFHQQWAGAVCVALNAGLLPGDHFALVEQNTGGPVADVLTLERRPGVGDPPAGGGSAVATTPRPALVRRWEQADYAGRASRISVRHLHGDVVAVIEIVSPGNKGSRYAFDQFVKKSADLIRAGVHLVVVDPFPPGRRDPHGVHAAISDAIEEGDPYLLPAGKPLAATSIDAGHRAMYVEAFAVGDPVPEMPLFLWPGRWVPCPLDAAYQGTWRVFPQALKGLLEPGGE